MDFLTNQLALTDCPKEMWIPILKGLKHPNTVLLKLYTTILYPTWVKVVVNTTVGQLGAV